MCILPDNLTSPKLTAEWENNLTQIAKGEADPAAFMDGIEAMTRELVQTYSAFWRIRKIYLRQRSRKSANAPAAAPPFMRERKTITVLTGTAPL